MKKFEKVWTDGWYPDYTKFLYSGWAILDKIKPEDRILDIGCGYNLFKKHFGDRLYGIDPYNPAADELVSWEDYQPKQKFNVYFALGSLHFGDDEIVESQIKKLSDLTNPGNRIFWRQNPGTQPCFVHETEMGFNGWTFEKNHAWSEKYNFSIVDLKQDTGDRIYAERIKN